jgi:hypothetical protein
VIRLVTEEAVRVMDALRQRGYEPRQVDVLVTDAAHKPGMLHRITSSLAQGGIDIHHLYATAGAGQDESMVVYATSNNDRAMVLVNTLHRKA